MKRQKRFKPSQPRWLAFLVLACLLGLLALRDPHGVLGHELISGLFNAFGKGHGLSQTPPSGSPRPAHATACAFFRWSSTLSSIALSVPPPLSLPNPISPIPSFTSSKAVASWGEPFHSRAPPLPA